MLQSCCRSCQIRTILLKISVRVGFVSKFQIYGQRKVELATQLRISVACGTQHISVCAEGFLGIFVLTPKLSADSLRSLCTSSQPRHLWSNEPATDRAKSGDMRKCASFWLVLLAYDMVPETWAQLSCFDYAVMLQHFLLWFFSCRDESMNPYQTDVVTHRNSGVPVKCILGIFNGIYSEQTGVPQEFVGSSSAWCLRILGRHPAINLLPPRAVETVVALER